jgi:hypothetical protein
MADRARGRCANTRIVMTQVLYSWVESRFGSDGIRRSDVMLCPGETRYDLTVGREIMSIASSNYHDCITMHAHGV